MMELVARRASGRLDELRMSALAAIRRGPAGVLPILVASTLIFSGGAVLILTAVSSSSYQPSLNDWVRGVAAGIFALTALAYLIHLFRSDGKPADESAANAGPDQRGLVTGMLSLSLLLLLLLVPAYLLAARTHAPSEHWIGYGFFDKRWLVATFMLGTIGALVVLAAVGQLVRSAYAEPASWRGWAGAAFGSPAAPASRVAVRPMSLVRTLLLAGAGVVFAAYFFAPPWHVSLANINIHETPMMAGVQGIAHGAIPYIDSAAVQYGPGSELIHYAYLKTFGFDVVNFRQSTVLLYWLAATIFFVVLFLRLPTRLALITSLVSILVFPTLQMVLVQPNGSIDAAIDHFRGSAQGVWGWPNAMRYIGVFSVSMLFPAVAAIDRARRAKVQGVALGLLFGLTCYVSQENLIGGLLAIGTLAVLLIVSQTVPARLVGRAVLAVAAGFGVIAAIVLGYYAVNGELVRFLQLYYLIPPAVAAGYSDTVYFGGFAAHWAHVYYLLPFFLGGLCVLSVIRLGPPRVARNWSQERVLLVSALVAACISLTGAFLRSDGSHLVNTLLATPVALVLAVAYLPRLLGIGTVRRRVFAAMALAAIPLAMLPFAQIKHVGDRLTGPLARFDYHSPALQWQRAAPESMAARRLGPVLQTPDQWCCTYFRYPVSMREFAQIINRIHAVVGDRRVYVANFIDGMEPGAAYFVADLNPAPTNLEPFTMVMNQDLLRQFLDYFQDHISDVQAIVAVFPNLPEVRMFEKAYPNYRRTEIPYTWGSITVLTRS